MSATIPLSGDVAELIGHNAERVENRSLLLDKFVFHKRWPVVEEQTRRGHDFVKWDEASRWSFIRIADGASQILNREAQEKRRKANGNNVDPQNRERMLNEAKIAESLSNVKWESKDLQNLRQSHTRRFIGLFRTAYADRASISIGQLEGRLAINLADSLIQNAGISLDRLFGLPFIPGSAIKGVTRHAALEDLNAATDTEMPGLLATFCTVFGTSQNDFKYGDLGAFQSHWQSKNTDCKGAISFLPAFPVNDAKIVVDLTNVHFPDYYRTGRIEEQSNERPQPNPFPVVETGAQFAFCLVLNGMKDDPALLATATRWLETALTERGLGAKTASGYGWFSIQSEVLAKIISEAEGANQKAKDREEAALLEPDPELTAKFEAMKEMELASTLNKYAFDSKLWPKDSTLIFEVSLFEFIKNKFGKLAETKNGGKAMKFLALKLNKNFP